MSLVQLPPSIDIKSETKKAIIDGLKKVIEAFQANGLLDKAVNYQELIHNPEVLYGFIQSYRSNPSLAGKIVVGKDGKPVTAEDHPLVCGVTLAQIQQLLVKTCARFYFEQMTREEEEVVTETRTTTRFIFFKKTEQVERKTGGGFDERRVRELTRFIAFDWQLPLLEAYAQLHAPQLMELDKEILALRSVEALQVVAQFDQPTLKKVRGLVGEDFVNVLAHQPLAIGGIAQWSKDMFTFYRNLLGERAYEFFCRDKAFFMGCASLDKPLARVYGDVLPYIATENLEELQRLNIDKVDVLIGAMKQAFGDRIADVLSQPGFAKDVLRKLVESLLHLTQEKDQLAVSAQLTCKAITPQVFDWLAKQTAATA